MARAETIEALVVRSSISAQIEPGDQLVIINSQVVHVIPESERAVHRRSTSQKGRRSPLKGTRVGHGAAMGAYAERIRELLAARALTTAEMLDALKIPIKSVERGRVRSLVHRMTFAGVLARHPRDKKARFPRLVLGSERVKKAA